mmetsp:Transcript_13817/g.31355  ORF Transcript_13817/g.31355 Transcript_13817/m.31355 type:complete len:179 (-) Transcript_13817:205-741(-)|eukprot:CAMPEP_0197875606 /NCGR_PEP_ID=MMETSP1439-20131203/4814_1 /TAXON_ID=66791 /ORGANISM="Gonyaulax spinifera, Strain CCMP409" /LENGTH=178 /DNA_ID=CAMNT_0043494821 /DNA_START=90 /DNA_END=626 /DNA_ORIENTATION=+
MSLVEVAKDTLVDQPVEQILKVHDEMERWIYKRPGGTLSEMEVSKDIVECCEFAVLELDAIKPYIMDLLRIPNHQWNEMDELVRAIQRTKWTSLKGSIIFEIKIPPTCGGTRILGSYLLGTKKLTNGDYEVLFTGYREKSTLIPVYRWLAENHDDWKIKQYLKGKLIKQLQMRLGCLR